MDGALPLVGALIGLAIAPFLRRLADQVPGRHPLFGSSGGRPFVASELIPVASWFADDPAGTVSLVGSPDDRDEAAETLQRRWRAPVIDLTTAALCGAMAHHVGWQPALAAFLVFSASMVVVTVIDIDHFRIPDRITFPTLGLCVTLLAVAAAIDGLGSALVIGLVGAAAYFVFLFLFFIVWPRGMGFGDVKLAAVLGLHLGWAGSTTTIDSTVVERGGEFGIQLVLYGALAGSLLGSVIGIGALLLRGRNAAFPFGPALCAGALAIILASDQLLG